MKRFLISATLVLCGAFVARASCISGEYPISVRTGSPWKEIRLCKGTKLIIVDLDPVANSYRLDSKTTIVNDAVDLSGLGIIPVPSSGTSSDTATTGTKTLPPKKTEAEPKTYALPLGESERDTLNRRFNTIALEVDSLGSGGNDKLTSYQTTIQALVDSVADLTSRLSAFRNEPNLDKSLAKTRVDKFLSELDAQRSATWPAAAEKELQNEVNSLSAELAALPRDFASVFSDWRKEISDGQTNRTRYDQCVKRLADVQKFIKDAQQTKTDWQKARTKLDPIYERFQRISAKPDEYFTITYTQPGCSIKGSSTVLKLYYTKLTVDKPQEQNMDLVTLTCDSPLSLSGGYAFSNLHEREFSFVPPATTSSSTKGNQIIGLTKDSKFRANPLLQLNVRLFCLSDWADLHYSFGTAVDLKGKVGTDLEFHTGPSLSVANRLFLSPGVYIGRTVDLQSGFVTGSPGYSGIQEPPVTKHYHMGFGFSITYKIK